MLKTEILNDKVKSLYEQEHIFEVVIESYSDGRCYVYCPSLKGCRTRGHNEEEAFEYMQEAIELYIEDLIADHKPIPDIGMVEYVKPIIKVKEVKKAIE